MKKVLLSIIESNNWTREYIYGGDGKWIRGINIVVDSVVF